MSTTFSPEQIANLSSLNKLRAPAADFPELQVNRGNSQSVAGDKYSKGLYRQKLRDIKQLGKDVPVTILNMNPYSLKINGGVLFPEEIPACPIGTSCVAYVLRDIKWQSKDNGCDQQGMMQMEPIPYVPLTLAAEYIREFMQTDTAFGGVLCYVGSAFNFDADGKIISMTDLHPSKMAKDAVVEVPELNFDNGELFVDTRKRKFKEIFDHAKTKQKSSVKRSLQRATTWYENEHQKNYVNDTHRDLARLALADGIIEKLPQWVLQDADTVGHADPCVACQVIPKPGAILCTNCGQIFAVLAAFKNGRIAYGAAEMELLTADEWKIANQIHADRQKAKGVKPQ